MLNSQPKHENMVILFSVSGCEVSNGIVAPIHKMMPARFARPPGCSARFKKWRADRSRAMGSARGIHLGCSAGRVLATASRTHVGRHKDLWRVGADAWGLCIRGASANATLIQTATLK
jgi:hypothetical protein